MYNEIKKKILAEIRRETNGAVVEARQTLVGKEPYISYGVALTDIKNVAKEYYPDHLLAMETFNSQIREMKLFAVYTAVANELTEDEMEQCSKSFDSVEVMENCAAMLFSKAPCCLSKAKEWIVLEDKKLPALIMAGKRARNSYDEAEREDYKWLLDKVLTINQYSNWVVYFIVSLVKSDPFFKNIVGEILEGAILNDEVRDEIFWQIEI